MELKIGTLNLCLGLKNKRLDVENLMVVNNIKILCLQEIKIESNFDSNTLSPPNFSFKMENNSGKARTGIYIYKQTISYK